MSTATERKHLVSAYALLDQIRPIWQYAEWGWGEVENTSFADDPCRMLEISTAGWSGNESLIASLKTNFIFWHTCWFQTRVGGHYTFRFPPLKTDDKTEETREAGLREAISATLRQAIKSSDKPESSNG